MSLYDPPQFNIPRLTAGSKKRSNKNNPVLSILVLTILTSSVCGFLAGTLSGTYFYSEIGNYLNEFDIKLPEKNHEETVMEKEYLPQTSQEQAIVDAVNRYSPAVVSIVVTKDVPVIEQYYYNPFEGLEQFFGSEFLIPQYRENGTERQEVGGGTGFLVSEDGMVLTNKHVVLDEDADYTIFTVNGGKYSAKVLARDTFQDLAILKIEQDKKIDEGGNISYEKFPIVRLGDSDSLQIGQTVIAIGNSLGEFRNTVSVGVVSGLSRTISASGGGFTETIEDVIQTDTAINKGNSGGPLLNLKGEVIGINTAIVEGAQNVGFSIPINKAKKAIEQVKNFGEIKYAFLGIRYVVINDMIQKENSLPVNYGAWIIKGADNKEAIYPGSAAEKYGLKEGDIVLEFDGKKITADNTLAKIILDYNPGDEVSLKILRDEEDVVVSAVLDKREEQP